MKKIAMTVAAVAVAAGTVLAAAPAANAATDASAATAVAAKRTAAEKNYLRGVRQQAKSLKSVKDKVLIKRGKSACASINSYESVYTAVENLKKAGWTDWDATAIVYNATPLCPEKSKWYAF